MRRSGGRRFAYRLALKLGHVDVDRMLKQISTRQLSEWRAYADLEPFDEERADLRAASIVQALLFCHRKKGAAVIPLNKLVLRFGDLAAPTAPQTPEEARKRLRQTMDILAAMFSAPKKAEKR